MNRNEFRERALSILGEQPWCKDVAKAHEAIMLLYDFIWGEAMGVAATEEGSAQHAAGLVKVQQTMTWSPLRIFWRLLAEDELLAIRCGAKGNIAEATGEFWEDPEVSTIAHANLPFMLSDAMAEIQEEIQADDDVKKAIHLWDEATAD